jgi:uncharacterized protein YlxW (UPF0749 family)
MKNIKAQLAMGLVCIVLGVVLTLQFKTVQNNLGGVAPAQKAQELAVELKKMKEEKEVLIGEVNSLESKMKEIEEAESKKNVLVKNMSAELEKYKIISGLRKVQGPGVVVVVDDPPIDPEFSSDSIIMYNYELLLSIVNKLNDAGAEAVSINGQRFVSRTEINLAGSNVNINAVPTAPPFVIKAIGNPNTLESTLNIRYGIVDYMKNNKNLQVSVKKQDEVVIPRYNEVIKFRYAKPVEDTE